MYQLTVDKCKVCDQGRTGTRFQAGKSHTHPDHPIHPQQTTETWTTLLAYLYDHHMNRSKSLVREKITMEQSIHPWKINKGFLLNSTVTSLFLFFIFSNISVTPFFLAPVTSSPAGLLLQNYVLVAKQPPHCNLFAHNVAISLQMT